jgi:hypothetical protein
MKGAMLIEIIITLLLTSIIVASYLILNFNLNKFLNVEIEKLEYSINSYRFPLDGKVCQGKYLLNKTIWSCSKSNSKTNLILQSYD